MRLILPKTTLYGLSSLKSYWNFDSDFTDQVGSNDLTASSVTSSSSGKTEFSNSATFNSGIAYNASTSGLPTGDNDVTINFWVYALTPVEQNILLYEGNTGLAVDGLSIKANLGDIVCEYDGITSISFGQPASLSMKPDWHMITLVYDASESNLDLYLDGTNVHSGAISNRDFTGGIYLGSFFVGDLSPMLSGSYMDELSVFDDALSASQIMQLYLHPGLGGFLPDSDTTGYWRFENDYLDDSGKFNHLHEGGAIVTSSLTAGKIGAKALSISGGSWLYADTSADMAGDLDLLLNSNASVVMWIYYTGYDTNPSAGLVGRITDNASELGWVFLAVDFTGTVRLRMILAKGPETALAIPGTGAVPQNEWCQVAFTRSGVGGDTFKFYINGELDTTATDESYVGAWTSAENFQIGYNKYNDGYFEGYMDDILIFKNRTLTEKEIKKLYTLQLGRFKCN